MTTATLTQAQNTGLRHQLAGAIDAIRNFSIELFTAHGLEVAPQLLGARGERICSVSHRHPNLQPTLFMHKRTGLLHANSSREKPWVCLRLC